MTKYQEIDEESLSIATVQDLYNENTFEYCLISNRMVGKNRSNLKLNNCKITEDISNNTVQNEAEFYNCCFENMKITNNRAKKIIFKQCEFENVSIQKCFTSEMIFENCTAINELNFNSNTINSLSVDDNNIIDENIINQNTIKKVNYISLNESSKGITRTDMKEQYKEEEKDMIEIIAKKDYENLTLTLNELKNKTFSKCNFYGCKFDESINLKANTDFISCRFDNCEFSEGKYDKVAFDESEFYNTTFKGDFIRCTFCKCIFFESSVKRTAHFFMCNFDNSNAYEQFANCLEQFTEIDFGKNHFVTENEENENVNMQNSNTELLELLKPVYDYLKREDSDLKDELEKAKNSVNKNSVEKFLLDCDDKEFMLILSNVSMNRSLKYQNKNINGSIESDNII